MSTKAASKSKSKIGRSSDKTKPKKEAKISDIDTESENEEDMSDKPKPMTLKFRGPHANKNGHLDLLLKIVNIQADAINIEGQDRSESIDTFLSQVTDDDYATLEAHLKKCKRSERKKKDKFIPKGEDGKALKSVMNSYQLFCKDERPKIKAANPEITNTEILSVLGASWTKLGQSKKPADKKRHKKYIDMNIKLRAEREELVKKLEKEAIDNGDFEEPKPKRPMSAYFQFIHSDEMKQEIIENKIEKSEASKYKSNKWKSMSNDDKSEYFEKAEEAKKKFDTEMIAWQKRCADRKKTFAENSNSNAESSDNDNAENQGAESSDED